MAKRSGRKSLSQTPAPSKERIYGSKKNPKGSASSEKSASKIVLSDAIISSLTKKLKDFKDKHPNNTKITLSDLKAVYRRGAGAYSSTHRPTITGGRPNTRNAWAMARVNKFLLKAGGTKVKKAYVQDDDLMKYADGGEIEKLIEDGIVEIKMYDTKPEHAKMYGFDAKNPLYIQSVMVSKEHRGKGIGADVFNYIVEYADKNGHDVIFGHITQKAEPNIDVIKSMLLKSGFKTNDGNNDFYKIINHGGGVKSFYSWFCEWYKEVCDKMNIMISLPNKISGLKSIPNKEENAVILDLFEKIDQSTDAKPYLKKIIDKADEYGVIIYLLPEPRHKYIKDEAHKKKITRKYLIDYYSRFGFELTPDNEFMKRVPKYADGGEIVSQKDSKYNFVSLKYYQDGVEVGHLNYYYSTNGVISNDMDNYPYNFNSELFIEIVQVDENQRNKGIAKKLFNKAIEDAKELGVDVITLRRESGLGCDYGNPYDTYLKSIYSKLGFTETWTMEESQRSDGEKSPCSMHLTLKKYADGGTTDDHDETYKKWRKLVNMSYGELSKFYDSKEGREAGLSSSEAKKQGISSGRESARWIMKMKTTPKDKWTPTMWKWANKQISFISRMSGNQGALYDENGNKTRKHTSLLIWGHNPKKSSSMKYENGGQMDVRMEDTVQRMDDPNFADISYYKRGGRIDYTEYYRGGGRVTTCEVLDKNGERKIDEKSIEKLTECVNKLPQTKDFYFHDGQYDPERKALHKEIIYKIKKNLVCVENEHPIAILMGGSPASGKSTFLKKYRPYLLENEILKVDADEIRSQLPEYKGFNATQTHLETKDIVNLLLSDRNIGIPCRFDLIYDGTMNNTKSYLPLISLLKSLGYRIFVVYIDNVPKDVIVNRALERYKRSGRFVPLEVIDDFFTKGKSALNEIKKEVDGYMIVDGGDSNYHVIEKGGMQLPKNRRYSKLGEPIKITTEDVVREYKKGGELDPDDPQIKNEVVHKSGSAGGMLVGKRHSEGGIKALNKSTGQPLEMEGGEVVITRNAVSDEKKREFEGKMMTNREILSKINESGGGVSFEKGGNVSTKEDCGCDSYDSGGNVMDMKKRYPRYFEMGLKEEKREHEDTFKELRDKKITLKDALEKVVAKHLHDKPDYYKNYEGGGLLSLDGMKLPSLNTFVKTQAVVGSPFDGDYSYYIRNNDAESSDHKYHKLGDKNDNAISNLLAYETYLYDNFGILFSKLPTQVKNALTLGKQALIDNYFKS